MMMNRLKRTEREAVRSRYGNSELLYKVLNGPARELERKLTHLHFTVEELFNEVFSVLDNIKEAPQDVLDSFVPDMWNTMYCDLRDFATDDTLDEEIKLATTEIVYVVLMFLNMCEGRVLANISFELSLQINQHHSEAFSRMSSLFMPSVWRLGEEKVRTRVRAYMDSEDEWISDDVAEVIQTLPSPVNDGDSDTGKKSAKLTNKQLIILFSHMLDVALTSDQTNINALAKLIAAVSGNSQPSIRGKIRDGVDFDCKEVQSDVEILVDLVYPVSPKLAKLMKNSIKNS